MEKAFHLLKERGVEGHGQDRWVLNMILAFTSNSSVAILPLLDYNYEWTEGKRVVFVWTTYM